MSMRFDLVTYTFVSTVKGVGGLTIVPSKHYKEIVDTIKTSRGYVSYIDTKNNVGKINKRYENYVILKQAAYTTIPPNLSKDSNMNEIYSTITPAGVSKSLLSLRNI